MKIYLYLNDKILTFVLPKKVLGSYSFDANPEEDSKLINIEERDGKWQMYSTSDSAVIVNGMHQGSTLLEPNNYYNLKRNNLDYLIYVTDLFDDSFSAYSFKEDLNILIGKDNSCSVKFNCNLIEGQCCAVNIKEGNLVLSKLNDTKVFVNNNLVVEKEKILHFGDSINIYGLKIMVLTVKEKGSGHVLKHVNS